MKNFNLLKNNKNFPYKGNKTNDLDRTLQINYNVKYILKIKEYELFAGISNSIVESFLEVFSYLA